MKHNLALSGLLFLLLLTFAGCNPDDSDPTGGGTTDIVAKFLGTWHVTDSKAKLNYDVTIERDVLDETKIVMDNFAGLGGKIKGEVVGDAVVVDKQSINEYSVEGTGSYSNNTLISFTYILSDGIDEEMRKATFTR